MDPETFREHRLANLVGSVLLLVGMAALLALVGWLLAGPTGLVWTVFLGVVFLTLTPRVPPKVLMRLTGAVPLPPHLAPDLHQVVEELARRAGLDHSPVLYFVPTRVMNAFALGSSRDSAIGVTAGLLQNLRLRELAGILAHEISHIARGDLFLMGLAGTVQRLTHSLSGIGVLILVLYFPLVLFGASPISLPAALVLLFAPTLSGLLQLALSRRREFDADLEAARLTGDPEGLARALQILDRLQGRWWEQIWMPGRQFPVPSVLRTHPETRERVARLKELQDLPPAVQIPIDALIEPDLGVRLRRSYRRFRFL